MKIAIIGAGNVGTTLGKHWQNDHSVIYGVRDPEKYRGLEGNGTLVKTVSTAIADSEIIVLAVPGTIAKEVVRDNDFSGKIVIDTTNAISESYDLNDLAELAPQIPFCKAFNHIGYEIMADPNFDGERATLLICGDEEALKVATELGTEIGFDVVPIGDRSMSKHLTEFAILWIRMAGGIGRDFAFKLLRR